MDSLDSYNYALRELNDLVQTTKEKPYTFLHLNATCHDEFLNEFNINVDSLPNALIYVPIKDKYTQLIGTFDRENISDYINGVIHGKYGMQTVTKDQFKFLEKDCSLIKDDIIVSEDDDDIMKEMMEEIKRKEAEKEKERIESEKKKGKKKKGKKKTDL